MTPDTAELILQQAPDALILVSRDGDIVYVNGAVTTLFGYEPDELVGSRIEALIPGRFRNAHERYRDAFVTAPVAREMGARVVALSALRKDGSEFPAEIRLAPIRQESGEFIVAAVRDVTDRRRITDELRSARAEADSANRAKTRFLATASHDLRQPLQTLQLLNGALTNRVTDPPCRELLGRQQAALESMGDLLNALLDITKLESGLVRPMLEDVPLGPVLDDLRRQFEDTATSRGLELSISACSEVLHTDRVLFRQMLQNLLNNALKFTREGCISLHVERSAGELVVEVADTGIGIPREKLDRIFDEYFRVDGNRAAGPGGFGLGLSIVRQLCRLHGYAVEVDSAEGVGSTFRIRIPADCVLESPAGSVAAVLADPPADSALRPGVLVIEDDDAVRGALELYLRLEGYPTRSAASGAAATQVFADEGEAIDLVVTDFQLGDGQTGVQVLEALRTRAGRDLPAVVLSGDTSPSVSLAGLARVTYLRKPVDARQLIDALERLFGDTA